MEETGYIFEDKNTINLGSFYQDQGCSSALNKFILAFNCIKKSNQQLDKDEYINKVIIPLGKTRENMKQKIAIQVFTDILEELK